MIIRKKKDTIVYKVVENLGTISKRERKGKSLETIELRYVAWNGREPRYEIRSWYVDEDGNETAGKGITMSGEELLNLRDLLIEAESE